MKIYTGGGDRGRTSLFSGERVVKNHSRVRAYGDVDELNSILGLLEASLTQEGSDITQEIRRIQSDLFHVGAWLATTPDSPAIAFLEKITEDQIRSLEKAIDRMEEGLRPLKDFILP